MLRISVWTPTSCSNEWDACQDTDASQGHRTGGRWMWVTRGRQERECHSCLRHDVSPQRVYSHKYNTYYHSYRRYTELVYMKRAFRFCLGTSAYRLSLQANVQEINQATIFVSHEIWCFRKHVDSWDFLSQIIILWTKQYFFQSCNAYLWKTVSW